MELEFLGGTKVALAKNVISEEESIILHNYAVATKQAETEELRALAAKESKYGEDTFIQLDSGVTRDVEKLKNFWGEKNVHTNLGPQEIQDLVKKIKDRSVEIMDDYLEAIDNPKRNLDPCAVAFDPIHVYSAGHNFNHHVDCHEFALVFYVSDPSEFEGGDLIYDAGPRITPTRGTLVIAPSDMPHEVLEVTDGYRCSLTTFFSIDE
jgi:hypothetical protein